MWQQAAMSMMRGLLLTLIAGACSTQSPPAGDAKTDRSPVESTPSRQSEPPGGYEGFLEMVTCDVLSGWAWAPSQPETPLKIDLYDGDRLLATTSAELFRQDLLDGRKGNGRHQFIQKTPPAIRDGQLHSIRARVQGTSFTLPRLDDTPPSITCQP